MAVSHVRKCSLVIYNLTLTQGWIYLLIMLMLKTWNSPYEAFWNARKTLKTEIEVYQILQALQWFDVVFPLLGFTRTVALNAFL